jgi:hypothetical protein
VNYSSGNNVYLPELFAFGLGGGVILFGRVPRFYEEEYYPWAHRRCNDRV